MTSDGYVVAHSRSESNIVPLAQVFSQHGSNKALETFVSIKNDQNEGDYLYDQDDGLMQESEGDSDDFAYLD